MTLPNYVFFKDRIMPYSEAKIGVLTHALHYGTGVFGGLRAYWNDEEEQLFVFRPNDHFQRFLESTRLMLMELPYTETGLTAALLELLRTENHRTDTYIRPLAFYGDELVGVRLHNLTAELAIMTMPLGSYMTNEEGAHVTISSWRRIDDNTVPARGKIAGAYVNSALAKSDAQRAGFDDALLLNQDGHLSESSVANIFLIRRGVVVTPPVSDNILEGITRRTMMMLLRDELGLEVVERSIDRSEIYLAEEAFLAGTGVQLSAIARVDHRPVGAGRMGPVVSQLRELYFNVVRGRVAKYRHWCEPVYVEEPVLSLP